MNDATLFLSPTIAFGFVFLLYCLSLELSSWLEDSHFNFKTAAVALVRSMAPARLNNGSRYDSSRK